MPREPERTCVGCRGKAPKRALLRIVASPGGSPVVDRAGGAPGRGAYLHAGCLDAATRNDVLARALRCRLDAGEIARLRSDIEGIGSQ